MNIISYYITCKCPCKLSLLSGTLSVNTGDVSSPLRLVSNASAASQYRVADVVHTELMDDINSTDLKFLYESDSIPSLIVFEIVVMGRKWSGNKILLLYSI